MTEGLIKPGGDGGSVDGIFDFQCVINGRKCAENFTRLFKVLNEC